MPDSVLTAAPQPEAKAQTSGEVNKGSGNLTYSQFRQQLVASEVARQQEAAKSAPTTETAPAVAQSPEATPSDAANEEAQPAPETSAETETEGEAQAAPETTEEANEALSNETGELDPKLKERINKRIGKEVGKRKELEKKLTEVQTQMLALQQQLQAKPQAESAPVAATPSAGTPLAEINDLSGLVTLQQQAKEAIRFAEEQLERDDFPAEGIVIGEQVFHKAQLREIRRNAKVQLEDHIPQRAQFLNSRTQMQQIAAEQFPFLGDPSDERNLAVKTLLSNPQNAALRNLPHGELLAAAAVVGLQQMKANAAKSAKPNATAPAFKAAKPPSSQSAVSTDSTPLRSASVSAERQKLTAERDSLAKKGGLSGKEFARLSNINEQLRNLSR